MTTEESIYVDIIEEKIPTTSVLITNAPPETDVLTNRDLGFMVYHDGSVKRFVHLPNVMDRILQGKAWREAGYRVDFLIPVLIERAKKYAKV